jgi:hypothetical protein
MQPANGPARLAALALLGVGVMGMSGAHASDAADAWYQPAHAFPAQGGFEPWSPPADLPPDRARSGGPTRIFLPSRLTLPRTPQNWRLYVSEAPLDPRQPALPHEDWLNRPRSGMELRRPL